MTRSVEWSFKIERHERFDLGAQDDVQIGSSPKGNWKRDGLSYQISTDQSVYSFAAVSRTDIAHPVGSLLGIEGSDFAIDIIRHRVNGNLFAQPSKPPIKPITLPNNLDTQFSSEFVLSIPSQVTLILHPSVR